MRHLTYILAFLIALSPSPAAVAQSAPRATAAPAPTTPSPSADARIAPSLSWVASPGAVAYRVYWRDTWSSDWQHDQIVGNTTRFVLPGVSIDDFLFGVAAIGPDGHESLISAYTVPDRLVPPVKLAQ